MYKAGWELHKSWIAIQIEKFLEKFHEELISSPLEEKKRHSQFSGIF